jgi:asparagine synthase (glutamine-hydrolysing)
VALWKRLAAIPGLLQLARMAGGIQAWRSGKDRWRKAPDWLRSIEGAWWLSRSILSPRETARRLGRPEEPFSVADWLGQTSGAAAADPALALAQYESMNYMRHQLLRDSDWASMDHSVELRTPLVHAQLLMALSPVMRDFAAHPNKSLLSGTLATPLPKEILTRPKTGFAIPVNDWIADIMSLPPDCDAEQRKRAWMDHIVTRYDELAQCRA